MRLDEGWNQIQFNLSDFTRRAYGTNYSCAPVLCLFSRHSLELIIHLFSLSLSLFQTTQLRLCEYKSTPTAAFAAFTLAIVSTRKTSYRQSSSSSCLCKSNPSRTAKKRHQANNKEQTRVSSKSTSSNYNVFFSLLFFFVSPRRCCSSFFFFCFEHSSRAF